MATEAQPKSIFRAAALERLSSPERLDTLMRVLSPKGWIPLAALGALVLGAAVWSVFGRIPVTATGKGVLIRPHTIHPIQSPGGGALIALTVREGARVKRGDVIGLLDQYQLRYELEHERARLERLEASQAANRLLEQKSAALEGAFLSEQRAHLGRRAAEAQDMADRLQAMDRKSLERERETTRGRLEVSRRLAATLEERLGVYRTLKAKGTASDDAVLEAERAKIDAENRVTDLASALDLTDVRAVNLERTHQDKLAQIAALRNELAELDIREKRLAQRDLEVVTAGEQDLAERRRAIAQLELRLEKQGKVVSEFDGRVLELTASIGQIVGPAARIGSIEEGDPTSALICVAYLAVKDGKRTERAMAAEVTPDTVERERFGSIRGTVAEVSPYPVSVEAAASTIGSASVAGAIAGGGAAVEVRVELRPDPATFSGYAWSSSRGPQLKVSAGTTATIQVTLEERAPVTYVMPFLRSFFQARDPSLPE